jgi:hypothetical protein
MAVRDEAWGIFARELKAWMSNRGFSSADLVRELQLLGRDDVNEERVNNWRKGIAPRLAELPYIVEALGMGDRGDGAFHPGYLAESMGIVPPAADPDQVIDMAFRLQKTELKYHNALARAASVGYSQGAAAIVSAATAGQRWAVGVWPAVEGPADCRMHVSDRIDIRRNSTDDGTELSTDEVWQDESMKDALRIAYAMPATRGPRWAYKDPTVSNWSISHIGAPMAPTINSPHPGFHSIGFYSVTVDSWVSDVASLVATVLGYGLSTTRDLAMEVYGIHGNQTKPEHREPMHRYLLHNAPKRRAWSHYGRPTPERSPFGDLGTRFDRRTMHVWLREDEAVLRDWVSFTTRTPQVTTDDLLADQQRIKREVDDIKKAAKLQKQPARLLDYDVKHLGKDNVEGRWLQVLNTVRSVLNDLDAQGYLLPDFSQAQRQMLAARPSIAGPLYRWLAANDCTAIRLPLADV